VIRATRSDVVHLNRQLLYSSSADTNMWRLMNIGLIILSLCQLPQAFIAQPESRVAADNETTTAQPPTPDMSCPGTWVMTM